MQDYHFVQALESERCRSCLVGSLIGSGIQWYLWSSGPRWISELASNGLYLRCGRMTHEAGHRHRDTSLCHLGIVRCPAWPSKSGRSFLRPTFPPFLLFLLLVVLSTVSVAPSSFDWEQHQPRYHGSIRWIGLSLHPETARGSLRLCGDRDLSLQTESASQPRGFEDLDSTGQTRRGSRHQGIYSTWIESRATRLQPGTLISAL